MIELILKALFLGTGIWLIVEVLASFAGSVFQQQWFVNSKHNKMEYDFNRYRWYMSAGVVLVYFHEPMAQAVLNLVF